MTPGIKVANGKITKKCKVYVFKNGIPMTESLNISFLKSFKLEMQ